MAVTKKVFGTTSKGETIELYSITNANGMQADIMTYGANLVNLIVPDKNGGAADVNLGYDKLEDYYGNTDNFGAVIGPNCNRIGDATFMLEGQKINLPVNDGVNNLHSDGTNAINKRVWKAIPGEDQLQLEVTLADGELALPGNRTIRLTYTLTQENELKLHYEATSDKNTILNLTNHAYFNLDGHGAGSIHEHTLYVRAKEYTKLRKGGIPTGEILPVAGTALDFTAPKTVLAAVEPGDEQTILVGGIDHNFVIDAYDGSLQYVCELASKKSGRSMKVFTNLPGIQVYAGNFIGDQTAKAGASYTKRSGIALETQFFPDAPNHDNFASTVFGPERIYDYTTIYKFAW